MAKVEDEVQTYPIESPEEMARLSNQHEVIKDAMGGLLLVPVDLSIGAKRILDSGTADGTWIRDLQNQGGSAHIFFGTDIDTSKFPKNPVGNVSYHFQNVKHPWPTSWNQSFDIVHQRLVLAGAGPDAKAAVKGLTELVKPGGWIQLIEGENFPSDKEGPVMREFMTLLRDLFKVWEAIPTLSRELVEMLRAEGFIDIEERLVTPEFGAGNKNEKLIENGTYSMKMVAVSLIDLAMKYKNGENETNIPLSLTNDPKELESLLTRLVAELNDKTIGDGFPLRVI